MTPSPQELRSFLEAEHETLQALAAALAAEHEALISRDVGTLEATTATKNRCIEAHSAQQQKRLGWMQDLGLAADTALSDLVSRAGGDADLADLRARLATLAQDCQDANRRNGGLILRLQERTRDALDVLRREERSDLYSLSGAHERKSDGRTLGKA
jgi:flagellar biosynthesis/type III secretory pathway chaperone